MFKQRWKELFLCIGFSFYCISAASQVRIAIIDTGLNVELARQLPMCKQGGYDYENKRQKVYVDRLGHGSLMALIVSKNISVPYCFMIYKVTNQNLEIDYNYEVRAILDAANNNADVINISLTGDKGYRPEYIALQYASMKRIRLNIAAGNRDMFGMTKNLDIRCNAYPACYRNIKNIRIVGALDYSGNVAAFSNYGKVIHEWHLGIYGQSIGTSLANAVATAKYANGLYKKGNK